MKKRFILVAGPFATEKEAQDTAEYLGRRNHSVFSQYVPDADGYITADCTSEYFVERDTESPSKTWDEISGMQQKRKTR